MAHAGADPPLGGVGALVTTSGVRVDAGVLARFEGTLVVTTTSGFDHVDLAAARARGVAVARVPLARRDAVVDWSLGAMIALIRRFPVLDRAAVEGRWARDALPALAPRGLAGARVLVVGLGVIGAKLAVVLDALGAEVLGVDPAGVPAGVRAIALADGLHVADVVTLHCELTQSSRGILSAAALDALPAHAVVVNSARGAVLDVDAAVARVRDGRLRGLAVDVFPVEPWPGLAAAAIPGVILAPHAAGYTAGLGARVADGVTAALAAWVAGAPVPWAIRER
jgi:D-3-phosphoglycerate dehydrogenase